MSHRFADESPVPISPVATVDPQPALAMLLEQAPTFLALLRGEHHHFHYASRRLRDLIGQPNVVGFPLATAWPEAIRRGLAEYLDGVRSDGGCAKLSGVTFNIGRKESGQARALVLDFECQRSSSGGSGAQELLLVGTDVSDREEAERALRGSEASFRAAMKAGRMGSWETDHATKTRTWSQEGMALFGLQLAEGRGQVGGPDDEYVRAMHPDDRHLAARFHVLARQQDSFPAEYRVVRPDGEVRWLLGRGLVTQRDAQGQAQRLVSIMADVTERRLAEESLRVERERLALALASGQMGAYEFNVKDGVLWWSPETYRLFGVDEKQFVPTPDTVPLLLHPDDRESFLETRSAALAGRRPFSIEFRTIVRGGERWMAHRGQAEYDAAGAVTRTFGIVMDVTERKRSEDRLRDADRRKDEFIAVLSHELRNPLAPIRNAASILQRVAAPEPTVMWCLEVIDRQIRQMARLLDDLLDISRLTQGQLRLRREPMHLRKAIDYAIETAQPSITAANHTFEFDVIGEPMDLCGDLTRLAQVFSNLLINAAKYTPSGGAIKLAVTRTDDEAVITVVDNGLGIGEQDKERIFELFGQVGGASGVAHQGQGIGLALVKGLVELHGGRIKVHSEGLGRGSRFEVVLPLNNEETATAGAVGDAVRPVAQSQSCRVLVADDSRDIADSVAIVLSDEGHTVKVAYDGAQALKCAEDWRPEIVLMDIGMPVLDGYAVCSRIRAQAWGREMLLIAQTGWGAESDRKRAHEAGFDHHLVKPLDLDALVLLIANRTPGDFAS